jgi:hypothetical protein
VTHQNRPERCIRDSGSSDPDPRVLPPNCGRHARTPSDLVLPSASAGDCLKAGSSSLCHCRPQGMPSARPAISGIRRGPSQPSVEARLSIVAMRARRLRRRGRGCVLRRRAAGLRPRRGAWRRQLRPRLRPRRAQGPGSRHWAALSRCAALPGRGPRSRLASRWQDRPPMEFNLSQSDGAVLKQRPGAGGSTAFTPTPTSAASGCCRRWPG